MRFGNKKVVYQFSSQHVEVPLGKMLNPDLALRHPSGFAPVSLCVCEC